MTVLESRPRYRGRRQARREAERVAQLLLRRARRLLAGTVAAAAVLVATGAVGLLLGNPVLLLAWPVALLSLAATWALVDARGRQPTPPTGIRLDAGSEHVLYEHLADVAHRVGTRVPDEVWLVPEAIVRVDPDPGQPVLYLGAPLLWHLDVAELDRFLARELALMVAVLDPEIEPAFRLAARLDVERLTHDTTPLVGSLVRQWGRGLAALRQTLLADVRTWSESCVPEQLRPGSVDLEELTALCLVDELVTEQRLAALAEGVGVAPIGAHIVATMATCEAVGVLEPRPDRVVSRRALDLVSDPEGIDERLSERAAVSASGVQLPVVSWDELPERVWLARWRRQRDAALPAVAHLSGIWPTNLRQLVSAVQDDRHYASGADGHPGADPGSDTGSDPGAKQGSDQESDPVPGPLPGPDPVAALGELLARYPVRDLSPHNAPKAEAHQVLDPGEVVRQRAVTGALAAAVRVCAVEQGRLDLSWDDAWGARLVDADGDVVPVEAFVADAVAHRRVSGLLEWLGGLGAGLDNPWLVREGRDTAHQPALPITAFTGLRNGQGIDVVVMDGWLLGYPHPRRGVVGAWRQWLRPSQEVASELLTLASEHRPELVAIADPEASVRLVDVTRARMRGPVHAGRWHLDIKLHRRSVSLSGAGDGRELASVLATDLGPRLSLSGAVRPDLPAPSLAARAWWMGNRAALVVGGFLALMAVLGANELAAMPGTGPVGEAASVVALGLLVALACSLGLAATLRRLELRGPASGNPPRSTWADHLAGATPATDRRLTGD